MIKIKEEIENQFWLPLEWEGKVKKQGGSLVMIIPHRKIIELNELKSTKKGILPNSKYKAKVKFDTVHIYEDNRNMYGIIAKNLYNEYMADEEISVDDFFSYMSTRGAAYLKRIQYEDYLEYEKKNFNWDDEDIDLYRKIHKIFEKKDTLKVIDKMNKQ